MSYRNEENSTKSLRKDFLRSIDKSVVSELLDIYEDKILVVRNCSKSTVVNSTIDVNELSV